MKRIFIAASATLAVLLAVSAVSLLYPTPLTAEEAPAAQVKVDNFTFGPETLTVPVNSTVTWVNKDDIPHVIMSTDGLFKSKAIDTDQTFSFTFTKAGVYPYYCSIHPKMVGKIIVQ